jgi:arylsulfatase A-like enzyme
MKERPNLLILWTDQQRADSLGCYGNRVTQTPNLDRLADGSFVFERAYCAQPVCTPSRGTIMTGLWPHTHGADSNNIPLGRDVKSIAEMVPDRYRKAYMGKWHLGDEIFPQHGFEEWTSMEDSYIPHYSDPNRWSERSDYHQFLHRDGFPCDGKAKAGEGRVYTRRFAAALPESLTKAGFLGESAAHFLREHPGDRPFLLSVNFLEPHQPNFGPLNGLYEPGEMPVGPAFLVPPSEGEASGKRAKYDTIQRDGYDGFEVKTEWDWRRMKANYYGLVTMVDNAVGRILDALEESGQADNTIVVYTSDHGEMAGDHALMEKGVMYEEAIRIPLLIRVPWMNRQRKLLKGAIGHIDLVPTLLDLLGQTVGGHLQGESRLSVLKGESSLEDNDVVVEWNGASMPGREGRTLISRDGWKLSLYQDDHCELFDLITDPHELRNLFSDPAQKERIRQLSARLGDWQCRSGDSLKIPLES